MFEALLRPKFYVRCDNVTCKHNGVIRVASLPYLGPDLYLLADIACRCGVKCTLVPRQEVEGEE